MGCVLHDRREGCGQARVMKGRAGARWVWEEMERERTKARLLQRPPNQVREGLHESGGEIVEIPLLTDRDRPRRSSV